jgi:hypothetical protein
MNMASRTSEATGRRSRLVLAGRVTLALAAVAALGLLASACDGSSSEGVAQVEKTAPSTDASPSSNDPQAAFVACMRENGAPDFPDPDSQGHFNLTPQVPRQTPGLVAATEACESLKRAAYALDPQQAAGRGAKLQQLLDYAACMRLHGVPNFPDPTVSDGGMGFDDLSQSNINPGAPVFKAAEEACATSATAPPKRGS